MYDSSLKINLQKTDIIEYHIKLFNKANKAQNEKVPLHYFDHSTAVKERTYLFLCSISEAITQLIINAIDKLRL